MTKATLITPGANWKAPKGFPQTRQPECDGKQTYCAYCQQSNGECPYRLWDAQEKRAAKRRAQGYTGEVHPNFKGHDPAKVKPLSFFEPDDDFCADLQKILNAE